MSAYLDNLASGKNPDGSTASAGNIAWAKAEIAKAPNVATAASKTVTPTPVPVGPTVPKASTPIPTPSTGSGAMVGATAGIPTPSTGTTATLQGPYLGANGTATAGKTVTIPTPTPTKTTTTPVQNGTLQGPYLNPNTGQYQQGANVVNGQIQYQQPPTLPQEQQQLPVMPTAQPSGLYQDPFAKSREDIAKLAADRIAKILQAGRTSAGGALTGAKNAYDYTNQIEGDNRTLRNAGMLESSNVFGGNFNYQTAMNNRNDSIADTAQDKDYNAQVGLINQKLADLEAAAPGDEQAIIDQLEQIERQTGISVAQLQEQQKQNQFNNSLANRQFGLDEASVTGQYINPLTGQAQKTATQANADRTYDLQIRQQHIKEAQDLSDKYGITVEPKDNYSLVLEQIRGLKTVDQQDAVSKAKSEKEKAAWDKIEMLGYVPPDVADLIGIPAYTQTQTAKNQAAQNAISSRNATTSENNSSQNQLMDVWKATGKAPAGIPNVTVGTPYAGQTSTTPAPKSTDYKLNPKFSEDIAYIKANPTAASMIDTNAQKFIDAYGYDGYKEMRKAAGLE